MDKLYIDANELLVEAFRLAVKIYSSEYRPDLIVGVWRGGAPVAIAIHEYFSYMGWESDHIAIRALSYTGINQRSKEVKLTGMDYIFTQTGPDSRILIVDDVFDTGNSFRAIIDTLQAHFGHSIRQRIKIVCPWYKPLNNQTSLTPDYYLHETDKWLVFPHELKGLSNAELQQNKTAIFQALD